MSTSSLNGEQMSSSGNTTGAVTGVDTGVDDSRGVENSSSGALAQTGTCFKAGPIAFTDTSKALVEVIEVPNITPVGGTQAWFLGQAVYKSELLPVTDFALWAGLSERPFDSADLAGGGLTPDAKRSSHRILVVQREQNTTRAVNQTEKIDANETNETNETNERIGLLVNEVSGHVVIEPSTYARGASKAGVEATLAIAQTSNRSYLLQSLITSTWLSTEPVYVVELQRLFAMDSFINIGAHNTAVHDVSFSNDSTVHPGQRVEAVS